MSAPTCTLCGRSTAVPEAFWNPNKERHGYGVCVPANTKPVTADEVRAIVREEIHRDRLHREDLLRRGLQR